MNRKSENKHIVDVLFVLALFCLFAIYAILLIIVGARVYQKTVNRMEDNFNVRTPFSYISEKIRQADQSGALEAGTIGDYDALIIHEELQGKEYCTYIYAQDGSLKELFTAKDNSLAPSAGQAIVPINDFKITSLSDTLYLISFTDTDGKQLNMTIGSKCSALP